MQDWDRLAMIAVGAGVSIHTGVQGWRFWKKGNLAAVCGSVLLILGAVGLPIALALFAS